MGLSTIDRRTFGRRPRGIAIDLGIIVLALLVPNVHLAPGWVEHQYSAGVYPSVEHAVAPVTAWVPFAFGDLAAIPLLALIAWWIVRLRAAGERPRWLVALGLFRRTAAIAAFLFLWFEAGWALNYNREPLTAKLDFDQRRVSAAAVSELARRVENGLRDTAGAAHEAPAGDERALQDALEPSFREVIARLGNPGPFSPAPPKTTLYNRYLAATAITGYTDPFTYEVILERHVTRYERPFTLAHEWGHLAGFASETAANFIAALTCTRAADPAVRYSGWLGIYFYLPGAEAAGVKVGPNVAADIAAIRRGYAERIDRRLFAFQWQSYGHYLKANGVASGTASYGAFIDLLIGSRLDDHGLPQRRTLAP